MWILAPNRILGSTGWSVNSPKSNKEQDRATDVKLNSVSIQDQLPNNEEM